MPHNISFFCQVRKDFLYINFFEMQHMIKPIKSECHIHKYNGYYDALYVQDHILYLR